ncbi:ribosome maturation factor RimM [Thiomicrorhabdus immobilis]|uniref:Ribosome maturation factor RimM n=1 Tax=Thiomicrorhabdus immobilis TaxID=2791037 RepID=A0ABM7MBS1_9GAMM|nr:ribosome maturation factor RimM [Thiomicrorhabdus immobilis]BCN92818.1 ribosome maturation factor RimM [Thiomicrorhabdus immobilis]
MSTEKLIVGSINGVFGVNGWVKIFSHTDPRENILSYSPWWIKCKGEWRQVSITDSKVQQGGKTLVAKLDKVDDRDVAREYMGCEIAIEESQLTNRKDSLYWIDLIGCQVLLEDGTVVGTVKDLIETGVHDVLRVTGEHNELIPFVMDKFILSVDTDKKQIVVDWELEEADSEI